ncbi:hypothetical protein CAOG_009784 [Capsaspora owczarzaki ATCC 30864]|uniref:Uncharacterized protein n=1 Tax=Capsaspora owczarzaki (strain ATCC 30864) TaxID=595528 RepID=A0A0D2UFV4_CAPO3|nr:hypothetical protein CAOG_009784 [Capsaspora owczarzaki ATCC 30864]
MQSQYDAGQLPAVSSIDANQPKSSLRTSCASRRWCPRRVYSIFVGRNACPADDRRPADPAHTIDPSDSP